MGKYIKIGNYTFDKGLIIGYSCLLGDNFTVLINGMGSIKEITVILTPDASSSVKEQYSKFDKEMNTDNSWKIGR